MNDQASENQNTPQNETAPRNRSGSFGWITASAFMWLVGGFVAFMLVMGAVIALTGSNRSTNTSLNIATATVAQPAPTSFEPPLPVNEQNFGRVPVPTYLDATRACNATAGQDPKTMDPVMRSRCAAPNTNSDMYVIRILLNAGEKGSIEEARKAFTPGTSDTYIAKVLRDRYIYQNMSQLFWSGSVFPDYQYNGTRVEFEQFYGAIAYADHSYRRFAAVFQKMNGEWKLRSMEYEPLS